MTQNQISFAKVAEDARHNKELEKLTKQQNKLTKTQVEAQKAHYERSDAYTDAHYQRSDAASMTSANAAAMNAVTNRKQYEMAYDIEYGWTGDQYYPKGMPLSAQVKSSEAEQNIARIRNYDADTGYKRASTNLAEAETGKVLVDTQKSKAETDKAKSDALSTVLNTIFGRSGLIGAVDRITNPWPNGYKLVNGNLVGEDFFKK